MVANQRFPENVGGKWFSPSLKSRTTAYYFYRTVRHQHSGRLAETETCPAATD